MCPNIVFVIVMAVRMFVLCIMAVVLRVHNFTFVRLFIDYRFVADIDTLYVISFLSVYIVTIHLEMAPTKPTVGVILIIVFISLVLQTSASIDIPRKNAPRPMISPFSGDTTSIVASTSNQVCPILFFTLTQYAGG
jgi:hypothetical protein